MKKTSILRPLIAFVVLIQLMIGVVNISTATASESKPVTLQWIDLMPAGERASFEASRAHLIDIPKMPDLGGLNPEEDASWLDRPIIGSDQPVQQHDNQTIEIVGYPVPIQSNTQVPFEGLSFFLVPQLGAGLFQPLPSPNQTVLVTIPDNLAASRGKEVPAPQSPIKVTGTLSHQNDASKPYSYVLKASAWSW